MCCWGAAAWLLLQGLQQLDSDGCRRMAEVLRDEDVGTILVVAQAQSYVLTQVRGALEAGSVRTAAASGARRLRYTR